MASHGATPSQRLPKAGPYGQIILFGDSITENSFEMNAGFSYAAALSHGMIGPVELRFIIFGDVGLTP